MTALLQPPPLSCDAVRNGAGETVIALRGELDLCTVSAFRQTLDETLHRAPSSIVVDLSGLSFIDSTGLGALLTLATRARRGAFELELVPGPVGVMRLFEITRTVDVLPFRTTTT